MIQKDKLWRVLTLPLRPIEANFMFFIFMFMLGWVCLSVTDLRSMGIRYIDHAYEELFFDLYSVCLILTAIPYKVRRWVRLLLYIILYATAIADVFCFVKFDSPLSPTMLLLLDETNAREAGEFLESYLNSDVIFSDLGLVLLLLIINIAVALSPWRKLKLNIRQRLRLRLIRLGYRRWKPWLGVALAVLFVYSGALSARNKAATYRLMTMHNLGEIEHELTRLDDCSRLYLPIYRLVFSVYANSLATQQIDKLIAAKNHVTVDSCDYTSPNIILIIGESYNKHHSQMYGYGMKTTPRQMKLMRTGRLIKFTDVVTPWNLTSYVFKNTFSLHVVGEKGEWCDYPLFPEVFRKAGYHVSFITNQFLPKAKDAVYDFSGGFFLNNDELSEAQFDTRNTSLHALDEDLLNDYQTLKKENTNHNLIIFHVMGQHVSYNTRYPKNRRKFKPEDYDRPDLNPRQKRILSDYDNAVLYNDSIVTSIVKLFTNKDAIVIYMPDHGEECFDGKMNTYGRLHSAAIDARLAREEFEIPFWIWVSHKYAVKHPKIFSEIVKAHKRRFMTDAIPHLLMYLAGIHTKDYQPQYNILSPQYDEMRPRLLKGSTDYDKLGVRK